MRELKRKLITLRALKGVLNVWRVLAVNRYKAYRSLSQRETDYFLRLREALEHLFALYKGLRDEMMEIREERNIDILLLSTDKGYVGDFDRRLFLRLEEFLGQKEGAKVNLYILGRRISYLLKRRRASIYDSVFTKDINWDKVSSLTNLVVNRFRSRQTDGVYILYQQPKFSVEAQESKLPSSTGTEQEESPFFYPSPTHRATKFVEVAQKGSYSPRLLRVLPPEITRTYPSRSVMNFEGNYRKLISYLLSFYINFLIRHLCVEHFSAINFARFRTISRILKNIERSENRILLRMNKLRQERINRELLSFANSLLAYEEKLFRDLEDTSFILKIDKKLPPSAVEEIINKFKEDIYIDRVIYQNLLGGFILQSRNRIVDASVKSHLEQILRKLLNPELKIR